MSTTGVSKYTAELVDIATLRPHPLNYRKHPADQVAHLAASIRQHGFYRNAVIANDGTILAGHGTILAASSLGMAQVPVYRLPIDSGSPAALKVLAGDNEIGKLAEVDDRALTELLKEVGELDLEGLLGTGYDDRMLANLVYVTRPASEIPTLDAAQHWAQAGMPAYAESESPDKVIVSFRTAEDRAKFAVLLGLTLTDKTKSVWWPHRERAGTASQVFEKAE